MIDGTDSPTPGRGLAALGRGGVPVAMAAPSAPVRRREADGPSASRPGQGAHRTREDVPSII
jgi:hypothetical protein